MEFVGLEDRVRVEWSQSVTRGLVSVGTGKRSETAEGSLTVSNSAAAPAASFFPVLSMSLSKNSSAVNDGREFLFLNPTCFPSSNFLTSDPGFHSCMPSRVTSDLFL